MKDYRDVAPQEGEGMGEEGAKLKGWGCTRGGLREGGKRGREREQQQKSHDQNDKGRPPGGQSKCF